MRVYAEWEEGVLSFSVKILNPFMKKKIEIEQNKNNENSFLAVFFCLNLASKDLCVVN